MAYIDPHISDEDFLRRDTRIDHKQSQRDFHAAKAEGGMDAAIAASKRHDREDLREGFRKIPGASRSGALYPHVKSKLLRREADGEIELQRDMHGEMIGYREIEA